MGKRWVGQNLKILMISWMASGAVLIHIKNYEYDVWESLVLNGDKTVLAALDVISKAPLGAGGLELVNMSGSEFHLEFGEEGISSHLSHCKTPQKR